MESTLLIILIGLTGGVAVGLQGPLASMISQRLGIFESVFIVHIGGALIALFPLLFMSGGKLAQWRELPWYTLFAGTFRTDCDQRDQLYDPRVGWRAAIIDVVAGQVLVSTVIDQFGWLGAMSRPMDLTRAIGLAVVLLGLADGQVVMAVRIGSTSLLFVRRLRNLISLSIISLRREDRLK